MTETEKYRLIVYLLDEYIKNEWSEDEKMTKSFPWFLQMIVDYETEQEKGMT